MDGISALFIFCAPLVKPQMNMAATLMTFNEYCVVSFHLYYTIWTQVPAVPLWVKLTSTNRTLVPVSQHMTH